MSADLYLHPVQGSPAPAVLESRVYSSFSVQELGLTAGCWPSILVLL